MTTEAEARARLLAHYEDRLLVLAGKLEAAEAELAIEESRTRAVSLKARCARLTQDLARVRDKARQLKGGISLV